VLALDKNPAEDGFLQMSEIYNLKLNAELVTLSACQTAQGKLVRGEGLVSLGRAFLYAGAKSVLGTLWSVADDPSSAKLMGGFYDYLQQGKSRGAALRLAKLDLINGQSAPHRHPFYWAAFVLMGSER
jgi:CHAT domain-containing protein